MIDRQQQKLFKRQAHIVKAISHPLRIAIVAFLRDGGQCVCDIAAHVGSERTNCSKHLSVMVSAGVLECRKEGLKVIYSLRYRCVLDFLGCVTALLKEQAKENETLLKTL